MSALASSEPALRLDVLPGSIARITFDQPGSRANTLGQATMLEFERMLAKLNGMKELRGLILCSGKPGMFIAGADLRELGGAGSDQERNRMMIEHGLAIIAGYESLPFPTVAAIDGSCMGGGLEVALGLDYRIAGSHPKTEVGFPEVKVGIIPGWGGTQRLTRLIGPSFAAELICGGDGIKASRARELGIVFDVVPSDKLEAEALRVLEWANQTGDWKQARQRKQQPIGLTEEQHAFNYAVLKAQVMERTKGQFPGPLAAVDAIMKGCNLPLAEGLNVETQAFLPLLGSPVSRNLIAVFFMTQRLQKDPGVASPGVQPKPVERVGVIGAGLMGAGIAGAHVRRGVQAYLMDSDKGALQKGLGRIAKTMTDRIAIGRMTQGDMLKAMGLISPAHSMNAMSEQDVVIEAVVENEEVKVALYKELQKILKSDAILASNTSTISITRMAKAVARPESFAGMHFFNPVDRMQLVEVIRGEKTSDQTVVTLVALAKKISKTPIVVKDCPGFLVNRILFPYINESLAMLEEGAAPRALDKAATAFGMPMGPITLNDLVGLDTSLYAGRVVNTAFADRAVQTKILDELVSAGRMGQKSGSGFYNYSKGSRGSDDPAFEAILAKCRKGRRDFSSEEITDRLFLPMIVEASRILMEGIVRDPGDVDMGLILGIGFPAFRGGLLRWADSLGLASVLAKLSKYESLGTRFQPTEQMRKLAAAGKGFYE